MSTDLEILKIEIKRLVLQKYEHVDTQYLYSFFGEVEGDTHIVTNVYRMIQENQRAMKIMRSIRGQEEDPFTELSKLARDTVAYENALYKLFAQASRDDSFSEDNVLDSFTDVMDERNVNLYKLIEEILSDIKGGI